MLVGNIIDTNGPIKSFRITVCSRPQISIIILFQFRNINTNLFEIVVGEFVGPLFDLITWQGDSINCDLHFSDFDTFWFPVRIIMFYRLKLLSLFFLAFDIPSELIYTPHVWFCIRRTFFIP